MTYTCQRCAISRYFHHVIFVLMLKSAQAARSASEHSSCLVYPVDPQFITIHYSDLPMVSSSFNFPMSFAFLAGPEDPSSSSMLCIVRSILTPVVTEEQVFVSCFS